jgi:phosphonate transport system substrate-binding protein
VIVTRKESGIGSLDEIRGRSFAFGDGNSTSSHIVPRAMLQERGISLDALSMYDYLGHHDDVARAVLSGEYDAGAVMESVALQNREQGLVVLATSPPVPEFNLCASPVLPEREREILSRGLTDLRADEGEGKSILSSIYEDYSGFTDAADSDYGEIREMMEKIALPES